MVGVLMNLKVVQINFLPLELILIGSINSRMGRLESCCCCISTRTGTIVLAVLALIGCGLSLVGLIYDLANSSQSQTSLKEAEVQLQNLKQNGTITEATYQAALDLARFHSKYHTPIVATSFVFCLAELVLTGALLYGVIKYKHRFMLPCIIFTAISLVISFIGYVTLAIYFIVSLNPVVGAVYLVLTLLGTPISVYFLAVVYSTYLDIRDGNDLA